MPEIGDGAGGTGFHEGERHGLALHDVPLEIDHVGDPVAKRIGHDENPGGERECETRETAANRAAFDVAERHAKRGAEPTGTTDPLQERGAKTRRGLGPHGLGGRQVDSATHRPSHSSEGRERADGGGGHEHASVEHEVELGKPEK